MSLNIKSLCFYFLKWVYIYGWKYIVVYWGWGWGGDRIDVYWKNNMKFYLIVNFFRDLGEIKLSDLIGDFKY